MYKNNPPYWLTYNVGIAHLIVIHIFTFAMSLSFYVYDKCRPTYVGLR